MLGAGQGLVSKSHFVQCVPWSFIQSVTQKQEVIDSPGDREKSVASRDEQNEEGEGKVSEHPDGQGVGFHVVDGDEGLPVLPHEPLAELKANTQAQGQAWLDGGGHCRQLPWVHPAPLQSLLDHTLNVLPVELLCHGGDDPSTSEVFQTRQTL